MVCVYCVLNFNAIFEFTKANLNRNLNEIIVITFLKVLFKSVFYVRMKVNNKITISYEKLHLNYNFVLS